MEKMEKEIKKGKLEEIRKINKGGGIGYIRTPSKWKDKEKIRTLVSFYNYPTKEIGKIIGRALGVIIKELKNKWKTLELYNTMEFTEKIRKFNKDKKWKDWTFIGLDIQEQFTNIPKEEIMEAWEEAKK